MNIGIEHCRNGLTGRNRDGSVVVAVEQVIKTWLSRVASGSVLKAIQLIGWEQNEDGIRQLLFGLFRCQSYSLEHDYQLDTLSGASTFLWLSYLEYAKHYKSVCVIVGSTTYN